MADMKPNGDIVPSADKDNNENQENGGVVSALVNGVGSAVEAAVLAPVAAAQAVGKTVAIASEALFLGSGKETAAVSPKIDLKNIPSKGELQAIETINENASSATTTAANTLAVDGAIPPVRGNANMGSGESYPKNPGISMLEHRPLRPSDHIVDPDGGFQTAKLGSQRFFDLDEAEYSMSAAEHFTFDSPPQDGRKIAPFTVDSTGNNPIPTFSGSATHVNPLNDPEIKGITEGSYSEYVEAQLRAINRGEAPISPLLPFTRMDPVVAQRATLASYNRFHIPVADNEFRKGFRHIFITRPECYICCVEGGLSEQAAYDEDFSSAYTKFPYICELLSPSYISKLNFTSDREPAEVKANWNFLLSNRITGMSTGNMELNVLENVTKSIPGYTVTTPSFMGGVANGTLDLSFRDTKNLEVYETLRLWMLYMHKRHYGIFAPPYNGYHRTNGFIGNGDEHQTMSGSQFWMFHPYDRAVEYPCTIFDIITDEADSKILYMCTYIGAYPATVSAPLTSENNAPITDVKVSSTFRYQARIENRNTCMALFNHNAGLTDQIGRPVEWAENIDEVLPILIQIENSIKNPKFTLGNYIGAANMFVGSPYIVIGKSQRHPFNSANSSPETSDGSGFLYKPYLKFMPINAPELIEKANLNITSTKKQETGEVVAIQPDMVDYSTDDAEVARLYAEYSSQYSEVVDKVNQQKLKQRADELVTLAQEYGYDVDSEEFKKMLEENPDLYNAAINSLSNQIAERTGTSSSSSGGGSNGTNRITLDSIEEAEEDDGFNWGGLALGILGGLAVGAVAVLAAPVVLPAAGAALTAVGATGAGAALTASGAAAATAAAGASGAAATISAVAATSVGATTVGSIATVSAVAAGGAILKESNEDRVQRWEDEIDAQYENND